MCYCFLAISLKTLQDQLDFIMLSLRNDWMICAKKKLSEIKQLFASGSANIGRRYSLQ